MASLALVGIALAAGLYVTVFVWAGDEIFDTDWSVEECSGVGCFFSTIGAALESIVDLLQFLTLTGIPAGLADPLFLVVMRFLLGLVWLLIILGFVRGSSQA